MPSDAAYETRYAHTHVLGGSGHGKTQLLQTLIHRDLSVGGPFPPSAVVIDSQGDLINTVSHLAEFDPTLERSLADRLLLIDPTDIQYPPAINLFDANLDRIRQYGAVEQERIMNGTIELYEYFFGALLGAGLSQKQNLIFRYLAQLMITIPGANIHTLRELLETPEAFTDHIAELDGTARLFFEKQFFDKSFDDTRTQVSRRLWGILANRSFERIFSSRTSRIDLFEAMNAGKIILINTAKDLLKQEGTSIFGRFFIAMIAQAALERAQIPREKRRPTFVYIDEAQDYFDENIDHMLEQVRKYKIGLVLAHQTLAQLTPKLKASLMANTGTKLVGGTSFSDAKAVAQEFGCTPEFLQSMRKSKTSTSFALWAKNQTANAREVKVQLGAVDVLPKLSDERYQRLIEQNRNQYCLQWAQEEAPAASAESICKHDTVTEQPTEENSPPLTHLEIQHLIRDAAHAANFYVTLEKPTPDGAGRVDVVLERGVQSIAIEIGHTTKIAHEVQNIRKCLEAGYRQVWHVSVSDQRRRNIQSAATASISSVKTAVVAFLTVDEVKARLTALAPTATTSTVRGYLVELEFVSLSAALAERKRHLVSQLLRNPQTSSAPT